MIMCLVLHAAHSIWRCLNEGVADKDLEVLEVLKVLEVTVLQVLELLALQLLLLPQQLAMLGYLRKLPFFPLQLLLLPLKLGLSILSTSCKLILLFCEALLLLSHMLLVLTHSIRVMGLHPLPAALGVDRPVRWGGFQRLRRCFQRLRTLG